MSELALTLLRFGFLALLWCFVLITVSALRRDWITSGNGPSAGQRTCDDRTRGRQHSCG